MDVNIRWRAQESMLKSKYYVQLYYYNIIQALTAVCGAPWRDAVSVYDNNARSALRDDKMFRTKPLQCRSEMYDITDLAIRNGPIRLVITSHNFDSKSVNKRPAYGGPSSIGRASKKINIFCSSFFFFFFTSTNGSGHRVLLWQTYYTRARHCPTDRRDSNAILYTTMVTYYVIWLGKRFSILMIRRASHERFSTHHVLAGTIIVSETVSTSAPRMRVIITIRPEMEMMGFEKKKKNRICRAPLICYTVTFTTPPPSLVRPLRLQRAYIMKY